LNADLSSLLKKVNSSQEELRVMTE